MKSLFGIFCIISVLAFIGETYTDFLGCPSPNNCPGGLSSNQPRLNQTCGTITIMLYASSSACKTIFGDSLDYLKYGVQVIAAFTTDNNVCDYFQPNTTVDDCLHPNGTVEANYCASLFALAYQLRNNCSGFYEIDSCQIPPYGQAVLDLLYEDPSTWCPLTPYMKECSLEPSPYTPEYCPNCVISSCESS